MKNRLCLACLILISVLACAIAAYALLALRASDRLLQHIAMAQPQVKLTAIRDKLGSEMYGLTDPESIMRMGSVKDGRFCNGKKLFIFYSSMPPTRAIDVYTDKDDAIVYVSWHTL